ncbi:MAG TPA: hypothetical protein GX510_00985 [Firmicutes bacterium]|nr:hypothetical protein [Candidatus Fermentithermobacillaceae bacterium]
MHKRLLLRHSAYPPLACPLDRQNLEVVLGVHDAPVTGVYVHYGDRYSQGESVLPMECAGQDPDFQYFRAVIPSDTRRVRYLFRVELPDGIVWFGESGTSENRERIRPFQFPYICEADLLLPPSWLGGVTIYQIFPDRFFNGDPSNDPPGVRRWDQELGTGPGASVFYGGDLEGIVRKLDYVEKLGAGLVYLTPVFTAPSSHKYDVSDYEHVDPCFGGDEALKKLSRELHNRGMKLMLDVPFNHSGKEFFAFKDVVAKGEKSAYRDWFEIRDFPVKTGSEHNYETFGTVSSMPKLRTSNPEVRRYLLDVIYRWTREFGVDGWRLDVANEVDHDFWREFRKTVRRANPEAFILGEIWHDSLPWLLGDQFDSVLNYPWRELVLSFFVRKERSPAEFGMALTSLLMRYPSPVNAVLVNLLGSHDTPRIMTLAGEDEKLVELMVAFLFLFPGIPLVYYGDEVGMVGGPDPDCRRPMIWEADRQNRNLFELYRAMVKLRQRYPWLSWGRYETLFADDQTGVYALKRFDEGTGEKLIAVFNTGSRTVKATVPPNEGKVYWWSFTGGERFSPAGGFITLELPPTSFEILVCPDNRTYDYDMSHKTANERGRLTVPDKDAIRAKPALMLPSYPYPGFDRSGETDDVAAFLSNSRTLFTLNDKGRILRWFWPHIDYDQHVKFDSLGLEIDGQVFWQDDLASPASSQSPVQGLQRRVRASRSFSRQYHDKETPALVTVLESHEKAVVVTVRDILARDEDLLLRKVTVENRGKTRRFALLHYGHLEISGSPLANTAYYDRECDGVITYRRDVYLGINSNIPVSCYACAPSSCAARAGWAWGTPISQGNVYSLVSWDLGEIPTGQSRSIVVAMGASSSKDGIEALLSGWCEKLGTIERRAGDHIQALLSAMPKGSDVPPDVQRMLERSVLVLDGLRDSRGGGFIAAPEFDPTYSRSGGYGYCWGRDASFIALALDDLGLSGMTRDLFLKWAVRAQSSDGSFLHRHYSDGLLAPSWGFLQIDETASLLFSAQRHAVLNDDPEFVEEFGPVAIKASRFLLESIQPDDGLPVPCIDLWEERTGKHLYTSAAVAAGLGAGAWWARTLGQSELESSLKHAEASLKERVAQTFWDEELGRFLRTLDHQLSVAEYRRLDPGDMREVRKVRVDGREVFVIKRDRVIDSSILGVVYPFGILPPRDERVLSTVRKIEEELTCPRVGGLFRYAGDRYAGGNPWIVTTLWLGLVELRCGEEKRARERLEWALRHATELDFLPEQVDRDTGAPRWVIPLGWSHAMFLSLAAEIYGLSRTFRGEQERRGVK